MPQHLLLLSSSRTAGTGFLEHAEDALRDFLDRAGDGSIAFAPFAGIAIGYEAYAQRMREFAQGKLGREVVSLHEDPNALDDATAIFVGGGNTFHLLSEFYHHNLIDPVRERVADGLPYVGWSAGSNLACPSIRTTNDMPIIQPPSFDALGLIPFQINPHYIEGNPPGHQGETRAERIAEFHIVNPDMPVLGLPEGDRVERHGDEIHLRGDRPAWIFRAGKEPEQIELGANLSGVAD
jgi:dipeptidase E